MNPEAFRDFTVNKTRYDKDHRYGFTPRPSTPLLNLPSLTELARLLADDTGEHENLWQCASDGVAPRVTLHVKAAYGNIGASELITFKVDTGAFTSTLSEETTLALNIDRTLQDGEELTLESGRGAGGQTIIGVHRWISVSLGSVFQQIPVLVPPSSTDRASIDQQRQDCGLPVGLPPRNNLLGMAQILGNYLVCLDESSLYVFRDIYSRRERYQASTSPRRPR